MYNIFDITIKTQEGLFAGLGIFPQCDFYFHIFAVEGKRETGTKD
jgi:hypothetical protein